jgi:hypothetical protein
MPFATDITIRFGDCDHAGLFYYPVIFHYLQVAIENEVLRFMFRETKSGGKTTLPDHEIIKVERLNHPLESPSIAIEIIQESEIRRSGRVVLPPPQVNRETSWD